MALGLSDIKRRIRSVKNTQKITGAVSLVATSKFGRIRPLLYKVSDYFEKYREVMDEVFLNTASLDSPFFKDNGSDRDLYIIITSDSGLCGNYNANAINTALKHMNGKKVLLITIGERGRNYFKRRGYETLSEFVESGINPSLEEIREIVDGAVDCYMQGRVQNVYIVYTLFHSTLKQEVQVLRVLPAGTGEAGYGTPVKSEVGSWLFEPSQGSVFEFVFPKYLNSLMYYTLVNSIASEYASRISSMEGATRNASEILEKLQNMYNRARQSSITQEITEIVSGAEALKD